MDLASIVGVLAGLAGVSIGIFFAQKNRRGDQSDAHSMADATARVQDSKNALDAWIAISTTHTSQIMLLTTRLDAVGRRAEKCEEEIVPRLEAVIDEQRAQIAKQTAQIGEQKTLIADLITRITILEGHK